MKQVVLLGFILILFVQDLKSCDLDRTLSLMKRYRFRKEKIKERKWYVFYFTKTIFHS